MPEFVFLIDKSSRGADNGLPYLVTADSVEAGVEIAMSEYLKVFTNYTRDQLVHKLMPQIITPGMIESCKLDLENSGIGVDENFITMLIQNSADLRKYLFGWYQDTKGDGLDTSERDLVHDAFAISIGAERWPMYRDSGTPVESDFIAAVQKAGAEGKIKLEADWPHWKPRVVSND